MSCKYLINGKWITENEFKQILNNGLLDNVIQSSGISLPGFPIDDSKIISVTKKQTEVPYVPANKLRDILISEIKTRQGYPKNMMSALDLNEEGTDFKIPLWASNYADRFESLLTSIITNKVVKQKFPGNSYVLGSEEGFRVKTLEEVSELQNSGIVSSSSFDPIKGLQPMRHDPVTGKILPAQIMIPFKFRNEKGEILNLKDFIVTDEQGKAIIDNTKIPQKILNLFAFRIPTQEQNSMASVEIVGFLPEASGDLVLAPRDFTKQMGSDFDVDKLYTYSYNTYYKDGKLHTDFEENAGKIKKRIAALEEDINGLKENLHFSEQEQGILDRFIKREGIESEEDSGLTTIFESLFGTQKPSQIIEDIKSKMAEISVLQRSKVAAHQNAILDIHQQVMTSSNPDVIRAIMSLDSFGEFESLAKDIYNIRKERGLIPTITTILSDEYQKTKYINATAGKAGVGVFSLDSTFNAVSQGKDLILKNYESKKELSNYDEILNANNIVTQFGSIISKGDLSNKYTLRSQELIKKNSGKITNELRKQLKTKSTIIRSLQSSAVDNEKAQILDKLNINSDTFDCIRALALLGFEEKDITGVLTQEIIWEYINELSKGRSTVGNYNPNLKEDVVQKLKEKYDSEKKYINLSSDEVENLQSKSGEELLDDVKNQRLDDSKTTNFNLSQLAILDKFLKLSEIGVEIKRLQSTINTESSGIPKSLIETSLKVDQINNIANSNIFNATKLLGDYSGNVLENPTTINGYASYYGTLTANSIYTPYFKYQSTGFDSVATEVEFYSKGEDLGSTSKTKLRQNVFKGIRSYLFSNKDNGLFTQTAFEERQRLFIDNSTNKSLASILQELSKEIWYQKNNFLNKLTFDINKNGTVSKVEIESATAENFDEMNIYIGFNELMLKSAPIGVFNGLEYTTRSLAQDLIIASFLEGGQQSAKNYTKYIPYSYLKTTSLGNILSSNAFLPQNFGVTTDSFGEIDFTKPSNFTRQYLQNNPSLLTSITLNEIENNPSTAPESMKLTKEAQLEHLALLDTPNGKTKIPKQFLAIFDSKVDGKYHIYEYDHINSEYKKIPTLTDKNDFQQYDFNTNNAKSVIQKTLVPTIKSNVQQTTLEFTKPVEKELKPIESPRKDLRGKESTNDILNNIETNKNVSAYNKQLLSTLRELQDINDISIITNDNIAGVGKYNIEEHTIELNYREMKKLGFTPNQVASTILHEMIHAVTSRKIKLYQLGRTSELNSDQIESIKNLESLQSQYIDYLLKSGKKDDLVSFHKAYFNSKINSTNNPKIQEVLKQRLERGLERFGGDSDSLPINFSKESLSAFYGAIKLEEFVTMALTDEGFQQHLNSVKDNNTKSFWKRIVDTLINLISKSLGIAINNESLLLSAIAESINLIQTNSKIQIEETQSLISLLGEDDNFLTPEELQEFLLLCKK